MSIFYNRFAPVPISIPNIMKSLYLLRISLVLTLLGWTTLQAESPAGSNAAQLQPLAFLTAHEWQAILPDSGQGNKMKIHSHCTWSSNGQAIRIFSEFITDGRARPYIDGLYAWDPQQRVIAFWYVDAQGNLTKGTVKTEGATLTHEFEELSGDGKSAAYLANVTPHADDSWDNEIFARNPEGLKPIVKVRYEIMK